jgi:hypothetical protein
VEPTQGEVPKLSQVIEIDEEKIQEHLRGSGPQHNGRDVERPAGRGS